MSERSWLSNGRILHDLDGWTASGATYSAGDGDDHYGVAVLSTGGDYIEQDFGVPHARSYTLHLSVKAVGADLSGSQATARIVDGDGNTVVTQSLSGTADTWTENEVEFGLGPGTTYTLRITNASATDDVRVDDIWLWWVPFARSELATRIHTKLARLATDRSLSTAASGSLTEGDYTYGIDAGLRAIGAINPETDLPDVRYLGTAMVDTALDAIELHMLERLERDYATEVDLRVGPRQEALSQIRKALGEISGGKFRQPSARVVVRNLRHYHPDFEFD